MGVDIHVGMDSDNDIEMRDQHHPRPAATLRRTHRNPIDPLDHLFTDDLFLPVLAQPYHTL